MKEQQGYTLVELVVALAMAALLSTLAVMSGMGIVTSFRMSKVASGFADSVSLARTRAVARYEQWRITFPNISGGTEVVTRYTVESCVLPVGAAGSVCTGPWTEKVRITLEPTVGLKVPLSGGQPVSLYFDRTGLFLGSSTDIGVCRTTTTDAGDVICLPGSTGRLIRIHGFSGIVET